VRGTLAAALPDVQRVKLLQDRVAVHRNLAWLPSGADAETLTFQALPTRTSQELLPG
jgi:hypothetical protein